MRVDHAGEYGARRIYDGQLAVLRRSRATPVIRHMARQEQKHLETFDRLLVETDAPFLSPQVVRGKLNQPANVVHTAKALAVERRVPYAELEAAVDRNAAALFGW